MIADIVTAGRMFFSLFMFALSPLSRPFAILYLLCGLSDAADGFIARKLHTQSERGAMLDSAADLVFAAAYAVKILPCLSLPPWIFVWIALIAVLKLAGIISTGKNEHRIFIPHSFGNRLTGILIFLLPLAACLFNVKYGAALACTAATVTAIEEIYKAKRMCKMSRYEPLWKWIQENGKESFHLSFAEIEEILGFPLNHSFLTCKKELSEYGYKVEKISMKEQTVSFRRE